MLRFSWVSSSLSQWHLMLDALISRDCFPHLRLPCCRCRYWRLSASLDFEPRSPRSTCSPSSQARWWPSRWSHEMPKRGESFWELFPERKKEMVPTHRIDHHNAKLNSRLGHLEVETMFTNTNFWAQNWRKLNSFGKLSLINIGVYMFLLWGGGG